MNRTITFIVVLLTALAQAQVQAQAVELRARTVLDGLVSIQIPAQFFQMPEEMLQLKYPMGQRPSVVYTNERGTVNVALNHTSNRVAPGQMAEVHQAMEAMFRNLYPSATWYRSQVIQRGGRAFMLLDLRTPAVDTEIRNMIMGTSVDGRMLLVSFNVTRELERQWAGTGQKILDSIRIRD